MKHFSKTIVVAGTGRNVGKTTLACLLIEHYAKNQETIAIKISPHRHYNKEEAEARARIIAWTNDYALMEEKKFIANKDTTRMHNAGAKSVYFIMAKDNYLPEIIQIIEQEIDIDSRIIFESAAIINQIIPEKYVVVYNDEFPTLKEKYKHITVDMFVYSKENAFFVKKQKLSLNKHFV